MHEDGEKTPWWVWPLMPFVFLFALIGLLVRVWWGLVLLCIPLLVIGGVALAINGGSSSKTTVSTRSPNEVAAFVTKETNAKHVRCFSRGGEVFDCTAHSGDQPKAEFTIGVKNDRAEVLRCTNEEPSGFQSEGFQTPCESILP